jgi:hypothetical protein
LHAHFENIFALNVVRSILAHAVTNAGAASKLMIDIMRPLFDDTASAQAAPDSDADGSMCEAGLTACEERWLNAERRIAQMTRRLNAAGIPGLDDDLRTDQPAVEPGNTQDEKRGAAAWDCANCGQKNAAWALECGRCAALKAKSTVERAAPIGPSHEDAATTPPSPGAEPDDAPLIISCDSTYRAASAGDEHDWCNRTFVARMGDTVVASLNVMGYDNDAFDLARCAVAAWELPHKSWGPHKADDLLARSADQRTVDAATYLSRRLVQVLALLQPEAVPSDVVGAREIVREVSNRLATLGEASSFDANRAQYIDLGNGELHAGDADYWRAIISTFFNEVCTQEQLDDAERFRRLAAKVNITSFDFATMIGFMFKRGDLSGEARALPKTLTELADRLT